jgi:Fructose-bisphosphate aldolase class-I
MTRFESSAEIFRGATTLCTPRTKRKQSLVGLCWQALVADGMAILAADETVLTVTTRRLVALTIESTPEIPRTYREMFFTTPGVSDFISGVIRQDETIHQQDDNGTLLERIGPRVRRGTRRN